MATHHLPSDATAAMAALLLVNLAAVWQGVRLAAELYTIATMLGRVLRGGLPSTGALADDDPVIEPGASVISAQSGAPHVDYVLVG